MRKKIFYFGIIVGLVIFLYESCRKDTGFYKSKATVHEFSGNTYEFLKSQKGVYDSFLYVIDRVGLTDSLKNGHYTVFAPTNPSFQQAIANVNQLRAVQGRPPLYLSTVPLDQLDSLTSRYLIRGVIPSDSMNTQDGIDLASARYGYLMHGKLVKAAAEGFVGGGPNIIKFSDRNRKIYTRQWSTSETVSVDIRTSNGLVDVLERDHIFGFDDFITHVDPTYSIPYLGTPLLIPGPIGVELYDKGGERVAYHDDDAVNHGDIRTNDGVDISLINDGVVLGWINSLEWEDYTVNIADSGSYVVMLRVSSPGVTGTLELQLVDGNQRDISGYIVVPNTGAYGTYTNIYDTIKLPQGRHVLRVLAEKDPYNLRFLKFMPLNRPYVVPGNIPAADFDTAGGEGISYHDVDNVNQGNADYRNTGVDVERTAYGGGYDVAYTAAGEWLNYTIDVKETGQYNLTIKVGTTLSDNQFHVEIDGADVTGPITVPNTGGWQKWMDISRSLYLEEGVHVMKVYEDDGGYNLRSFTFN